MTDLPPDQVLDEVPDDAADADGDSDASTEAVDVLADTDAEIEARRPGPVETGHPAVDAVLRSLETLDARPVDEHVAVFEKAHDDLRRTLSGAGDDQG